MFRWVDGRPAANVPLSDRGLAYGDGLFETFAVRRGSPTLVDEHLCRLKHGCARLGIPFPERLVAEELLAFCAQLGEGVAKLIVTRGDGQRGYGPPAHVQPRRVLMAGPPPAYPPEHAEQGIELFPCVLRLAEQPALAGLKHLNRLEQVLARAEWQDVCYAEGLLRDQAGRVVEGVFSNLFIVIQGGLVTPCLDRCGVAGVMRGFLLKEAAVLGVPCEVRDISFDELLAAQEIFFCNSVYGVWPVRRLETRVWLPGPLTRKLQGIACSVLE